MVRCPHNSRLLCCTSQPKPLIVFCVIPGSRTAAGYEQEDDWEVAGRKNKSSVKRTAGSQADSVLAAILGGSVCSIVKTAGMKPSIVTHRFTALDLDIAPPQISTIEGALQLYTEPDYLSGTCCWIF